jgi:ribonuclease G
MSEEILINVTPRETRVALVENGALQEIFIERSQRRGLVGNIYRGRVCRVLPGMQAAFVDIGLDRAAFLHASDVETRDNSEDETATGNDISQLLHEGQDISVQVIKDPMGTKGARLTTQVTIPSRYMVFVPYARNVGISQKIEDET